MHDQNMTSKFGYSLFEKTYVDVQNSMMVPCLTSYLTLNIVIFQQITAK